ncbi:MAG: hypothetical protein Q9167_000033 [Letrouitia subvulpina]
MSFKSTNVNSALHLIEDCESGFSVQVEGTFKADHYAENAESILGTLLSIFPNEEALSKNNQHVLRWYAWWIEEQLNLLPEATLSVVVGHNSGNGSRLSAEFLRTFCAIAAFAQSSQHLGIDEIANHLVNRSLVSPQDDKYCHGEARRLVFAVLGWQTMLYKPALGTCPSQQLAVTDEQAGYRGQAFVSLKQHQMATKRPLYEFLMGFGILLPPLNFCGSLDPEEKGAIDAHTAVKPSQFNAYIFQSIGHFKLKWVDILSCHLDLDDRTKTIYLFRHPSFCFASSAINTRDEKMKSVIHAAAAPADSSWQWATEEAVTAILQETLLSYRLLFGQNKRSKTLFKSINPFDGVPEEGRDTILYDICMKKVCKIAMLPNDKDTYELQKDFPALRSKTIRLHQALSASKPSTWKELWRDRRDSANWLTFWAVIVFGFIAILLALAQVLLQIIQIVLEH